MIIIQQAVRLAKLHALPALDLAVYLQTAQVAMLLQDILILAQVYVRYASVSALLVRAYYKLNALHANMDHFTMLTNVQQHAQQVFMELRI